MYSEIIMNTTKLCTNKIENRQKKTKNNKNMVEHKLIIIT